jgi:hypothetical protein
VDVGTIIEYVRNLTKKERKKINLPFHVDELNVVAALEEYILSSSHTKVRDSNSDFRQMYATFFQKFILFFYYQPMRNEFVSLSRSPIKDKKGSVTTNQ